MTRSTSASPSTRGSTPVLKQLLVKISAKEGAMTTRTPKSSRAQAACSREEPQPKFSSATRMRALRNGARLRMKSGRSAPSTS